jgi:hypothetical protein
MLPHEPGEEMFEGMNTLFSHNLFVGLAKPQIEHRDGVAAGGSHRFGFAHGGRGHFCMVDHKTFEKWHAVPFFDE